jgi:hypothetical protein
MCVIMTSASCSPAVASRRAEYDGDFRVQTLLGAQRLDAEQFFVGCSRLGLAVPEGMLAVSQSLIPLVSHAPGRKITEFNVRPSSKIC